MAMMPPLRWIFRIPIGGGPRSPATWRRQEGPVPVNGVNVGRLQEDLNLSFFVNMK